GVDLATGRGGPGAGGGGAPEGPAVLVEGQELSAGVPVGILQRVALDLGVGAGVVDQHDVTLRGGGEGVVARAVALHRRVGDEHGGLALGPGGRIERIGVGVRGEHAHRVVDAGG